MEKKTTGYHRREGWRGRGEGVVLDLNVYGQSAAGSDLKKERVRHSEVEGGARGV